MMRVLTWNTEWAKPESDRGVWFSARLVEFGPEVVCVTEAHAGVLPAGYLVESNPDYGYPIKQGRRKVILWSRTPWREVDIAGSAAIPSGRFASGVTETSGGSIRFVGVCIPWKDAHVKTGRKDRRAWEDHLTYLRELKLILDRLDRAVPTVVLGDFNQAIPRVSQRKDVADALLDAFEGWTVCSAGVRDEHGKPIIDHVATKGSLRAESIEVLSRFDASGSEMSDHVGLLAKLDV